MSQTGPTLPEFSEDMFKPTALDECDVIMKGGITSGIVYPYAILELATRYRFRSLGGTSAGAIAAAFAAAAEYSRTARKDADGFMRLKTHCDGLPERLLSLFQPDEELKAVARIVRSAAQTKSPFSIVKPLLVRSAAIGSAIGAAAAITLWLATHDLLAALLLGLLATLVVFLGMGWLLGRRQLVDPLMNAGRSFPARMFGFCSGLTVAGNADPGLTDWLHEALQDIAFGKDKDKEVLTFGHLERASKTAPIALRMVTTNLSMQRPHTLPGIGIQAGFRPEEWSGLFPTDVLQHLSAVSTPWKGMRSFPDPANLPVLVATRMSLSFPILFKAIPLYCEDYESFRIVRDLGGTPTRQIRRMWLSDGGISSNFPIHMFDAPLPTRPTFAISLDSLSADPKSVTKRTLLPTDAMTGLGIPINAIDTLPSFFGSVFYSAKDWQDQLLGGITGQRERIARIFLTPSEGGLNLDMKPEVSRALMSYGLEAGKLFTSGKFDFDEHRWRRLLAFYRNTTDWLDRAGVAWHGGYQSWYPRYAPRALSYKLSGKSRNALFAALDVTLAAPLPEYRLSARIVSRQFPRKAGKLRNVPEY
jgi:predicted acylesterase/phospholipase RssA